jgi:hypothetical protein
LDPILRPILRPIFLDLFWSQKTNN